MVEAYWKEPDLIWFQTTACSGFAETLSQKNGFSFGFWPPILFVPGAIFSAGGPPFDGPGGPGGRGGAPGLLPPGGGGGGGPDPLPASGGGGGPDLLTFGGCGLLGGGGGGPALLGGGGGGGGGGADGRPLLGAWKGVSSVILVSTVSNGTVLPVALLTFKEDMRQSWDPL
jgi:hypothetical protein